MEIKIYPRGKKHAALTVSKTEIRVLLLRRGETMKDLAGRIGCRPESLCRLLNGRRQFPLVRQRLAAEVEKMIRAA